ncbi:MAG: hypothetical protein AAF664_17550, partial [Planctomycetota bacterium]
MRFQTRRDFKADKETSNDLKAIEILLVEDSDADAELTCKALKNGKIPNSIHRVIDGVEAMSFLRRLGEYESVPRPDLILLDLNMPRMDG